jgi:hypothetical protein
MGFWCSVENHIQINPFKSGYAMKSRVHGFERSLLIPNLAISLPNIAMPKSGTPLSPITSPIKKTARKLTKERKAVREFMELLARARDAVYNVHTQAARCGSSTMTHSVASLLSEIIVLIQAVTSAKGKGPEHPLFASYSLGKHGLTFPTRVEFNV